MGTFLENNADVLTQAQSKQYTKLLNSAVDKTLVKDFNPVQDFNAFINPQSSQTTRLLNGAVVPAGPARNLGPLDHSPANRRAFVDKQVAVLKTQYPLASDIFLEKQVLDKMQKSPLAISFQTGAIPARLKQLQQTLDTEARTNRMQYRHDLVKDAFVKGKGAAQYTVDTIYKKLGAKYKLSDREKLKIATQVPKVFKQWKGWFAKDELSPDQNDTIDLAIYEIMSGLEVDKDDTSNILTLWLDESDISIPSIDPFDDASKVKKHQAIAAILGHIHRSRVDVVNKPVLKGGKTLIEMLTEKAGKLEKEASLKKKQTSGGRPINQGFNK